MKRNSNCDLCDLKDSLATKCLSGAGSLVNSSVVFVGDSPTMEDFIKTKPFSGNAGTLLKNTVLKFGGDLQKFFFTNVLGCKLFDNKKPIKSELDACKPYYYQEILDIKPRLVVALGALALESLTSQSGISKVRGNLKWSTDLNCYIYPTYHPAAILRNVDLLEIFEQDISKIVEYSNGKAFEEEKPQFQHIFIETIEKFRVFLNDIALKAEILSSDIESTGFLYLDDKILCISFSWASGKAAVIPLLGRYCSKIWSDKDYEEIVLGLKLIFETKKFIFQNGKFDLKFLITQLNLDRQKVLDNFVFDTMLAHAILEEEEKHGLKELAWKHTFFGGYEEELEDFKNHLKSYINKKLPLLYLEVLQSSDTSVNTLNFSENLKSLKYVNKKYKEENKGILQINSNRDKIFPQPKGLILGQNYFIKKEAAIAQIREFIHKENIEHLTLIIEEELTPFIEDVISEALKATRSKKDMVDEEGNAIDDFSYDIFSTEILWKYNAIDADVTFQVYEKFKLLLEQAGLMSLFNNLVMPENKVLLIMELNGIAIDMNVLNDNQQKLLLERDRLYEDIVDAPSVQTAIDLILNEKTKEIEQKFDKLVYPDWGEDKIEVAALQKVEKTPEVESQLNYYKARAKARYVKYNLEKLNYRFNINSLDQLAVLFFDVLKCQPLSLTPKGNPQLNIENLDIYAVQYAVADKISKYKSLDKFIGMFFKGIKKRVQSDGRLRTDYQQTTVTGRLKSLNPNLQNLPKRKHGYVDPKDVRDFFVAPEGYKLVHMDAAQAEFRAWCEYADDEDLMRDLKAGMDIHRKIAAYIFKKDEKDIDKLERNKAKFAVFGLIYGRGAQSIAEEFDLTLEQAQNVAKYFFSLYPKCHKWIENQKRLATYQGYVKNYFGRIRHLPILTLLQNKNIRDFDQHTQMKLAEAQRQCVNAPIQSFVSDFIGLVLIRLQKKIDENNYPVKIMLQIHDAIICEVKDEFVDEWCKIFRAEMIRKPGGFRTELDSETEIGTSYGNLKTVKND